MDIKDFELKLKNKQIYECVNILRKELIEILTRKIQEKDKFFRYSTTKDLFNKATISLESKYIEVASKLCSFDIMYELEEYKLDEMLEMYKELQNI